MLDSLYYGGPSVGEIFVLYLADYTAVVVCWWLSTWAGLGDSLRVVEVAEVYDAVIQDLVMLLDDVEKLVG
jgi:hypothetical protein